MQQGLHRRDWKTHAKQNETSRHPTRPYRDLRCFRARNTVPKPLWNEAKFIDRDPHFYMRRVKQAIHMRLHPDDINRDSGIEIPEVWMRTIKKHNNRRAVQQRTAEGASHWVKDQRSKCTNQSCWKPTNHSKASCFIRSCMSSGPHLLKKSRSTSYARDHTWLHRETNGKLTLAAIHHDE